jgi:chromate transporter
MIAHLIYLFVNSLLISVVSFGGGAQALFYQTAVLQKHLISSNDLSAVLAFGYATPGPAVFGTATFIGYRIAGLPGAIVGSIGIFLMPCVLGLLTARYISHWLDNPHAKLFIKGVGLAASGVVAATAVSVAHLNVQDAWRAAIAVSSFGVMLRWKRINPLFVLVTGGILGLMVG